MAGPGRAGRQLTTPLSPAPGDAAPAWEQRFRARRVTLPGWAEFAPDRCVLRANLTGVWEIYTFEVGTGRLRQVTDRRNGTSGATLSPDGTDIWWFADTDGDEYGVWMVQPFAGGPDRPAHPGVPAAYPAGVEIGGTTAVIGCADDDGTTVYLLARDGSGPARVVYRHAESADVGGLSRDGTLLCLEHSEHGDSRHPALRVLRLDPAAEHGVRQVAEIWDGPERALHAIGFSPVAGDTRLLVSHERRGRPELLVWDPVTGTNDPLVTDLPGEIWGDWYPDATAVLIGHEYRARSELFRYDLASGRLQHLPTPAGSISSAGARPDGQVWFSWSSLAEPPVIRELTGRTILTAPGTPPPTAAPAEDVDVDASYGTIHSLLARPVGRQEPYPAVFVVHGGPEAHEEDAWAPDLAAYVDAGYAVVSVNYRGSTGYGTAWRDAITGRPGLTELEDVRAVRAALVERGVVDPARTAILGGSWGGFLTLLALGLDPDLWACGVAAVPVADYVTAYADEMPPLQAYDRALFGGSPDEVPDRYRASSPLTYVEHVRAPVLVLAGENDPRCPIQQVDNYLERLTALGKQHEVLRFDAGHGSLVVEERIRHTRTELDFLVRHLPVR